MWIARLCKRGHEVTLFGSDAPEPAELAQYGQPVHEWVPLGARLVELAADGDGHWTKVRRLRRELVDGEFDVCLAMQTYPCLLALTAARSARRRVPVVISERSVPSMLLKRQGRSQRVQLSVARRLYRIADAAIAISHPVAADLISSFNLDPGRVYVVPNPAVDAPRTVVSQPPVLSSDTSDSVISIVLPSRLVPEKRPLLAVEVAEELRRRRLQVKIVVFGLGPLRGALEAAAAQASVPIEIVGWVDDWTTAAPPSSVVLLPSTCEGFGNVLVEAAAAGIPSVALSAALGVADALVPGVTGELVHIDSPNVIADAVQRAARYRVDAPNWLERFSVDNSTDLLTAVFDRVVSLRQ
jgi:glycosyltransferase involved in cell wall biosynthesis